MGLRPRPTAQRPNAQPPTPTGSTPTITTAATPHSTASHQPTSCPTCVDRTPSAHPFVGGGPERPRSRLAGWRGATRPPERRSTAPTPSRWSGWRRWTAGRSRPARRSRRWPRRSAPTLPDKGMPAEEVVDLLAAACDPGLTAMPSGRFFGFVIGGTHPAGLAADWLVSAWDQNSGLRRLTPAHSAVEDVASAWLLDLLGLPAGSAVGFVTGATMSNFTALAAGRDAVLRNAGWDVATRGLVGGPPVRVLVGAERHDTVDLALRYLGLGVAGAGGRRRPGAGPRRRPARRAGGRRRRGADDRGAAGRQRALRGLRPVRRGHRRRPRAGCVGARRRRLRAVGRRVTDVPAPGPRAWSVRTRGPRTRTRR